MRSSLCSVGAWWIRTQRLPPRGVTRTAGSQPQEELAERQLLGGGPGILECLFGVSYCQKHFRWERVRSARQGWLGVLPLARFFEGRGRQNSYIRSICSAITCVLTSHGSPRLTAVGICSHQRIRASWLPWLVLSYPCHPHDSLAHMRHDTTVSDHDRTRVKEIADARLWQLRVFSG